jgi:hypothetical protein
MQVADRFIARPYHIVDPFLERVDFPLPAFNCVPADVLPAIELERAVMFRGRLMVEI